MTAYKNTLFIMALTFVVLSFAAMPIISHYNHVEAIDDDINPS
jgi:hypothetical protein